MFAPAGKLFGQIAGGTRSIHYRSHGITFERRIDMADQADIGDTGHD